MEIDLSVLANPPADVEDIPRWLQQAMPQLINALNLAGDMQRTLDVAPNKPREGMIRYADGTNWDPGAGVGLYRFTSGSWGLV